MTHSGLGSFLRQLRRSRHMAQGQAAEMAGISRITLNRWESGVQQPRTVELESLLVVLAANPEHRRQVEELQKLSHATQTRDLIVKVEVQKQLGPMPHRGELLRALRMRRGLSQETVACRVGVTERTLRRWEKAENWPSDTQLHTLCSTLNAYPAETFALTTDRFLASDATDAERSTLQDLLKQSFDLYYYNNEAALTELTFLTLESRAWLLIARSGADRQALAQIYGYHAAYLSKFERFAESNNYALRALDLWPLAEMPDITQVMSGIVTARYAAYGGAQITPWRGVEILRHWFDAGYCKSWVLSEAAKYLAQSGDMREGIALAKRASELELERAHTFDFYNRVLDEAQVLTWSKKSKQALELLQQSDDQFHRNCAPQVSLLEAEAYIEQGQLAQAHDRLQAGLRILEGGTLPHLMIQARKLALCF